MGTNSQNHPGGLLIVGADGTILEAPSFLTEWFGEGNVESVFALFAPDRTPHLTLRRVVASGVGRMEFHVELSQDTGRPKFLRYWDLTQRDAELATFFLVDDTSVVESFQWRAQRTRRALSDDVRELIARRLRPAVSNLTVLADVALDRPDLAVEALEKYRDVAYELAQRVREMDDAIQARHSIDLEIPFRVVDLTSVLSSCSNERASVACQLFDVTRDLFVSSAVIEHVVLPVLENAIDARPKDGWVHVVATRLPANKVCIEVQDLGRGMTQYEMDRAQDPFYSTKRGHMGLGLSAAAEVLKATGGYWNFSSARRKGTRVRICVPCVTPDDNIGPTGRT